MSTPNPNWFEALPQTRLMAEFSVWSSDLLNIGRDLDRVAPYADLLHIDVADGHFAPAFLFFPDLVDRIRKASPIPIHVHLMTSKEIVLDQIDQFAEAGADVITVHAEMGEKLQPALDKIASYKLRSGVVLRVETPVDAIASCLDRVSFVTLLGTAIGVKGKGLHEDALDRMQRTRAMIQAQEARAKQKIILVADGGIREETTPLLRNAGAQAVVMGSLAYGASDLAQRMQWIHSL